MQVVEQDTGLQEGQEVANVASATAQRLRSLPLRARIVAIANAEWRKWNRGGRRSETDPRMRPTLADYWLRGVGQRISDSHLASTTFQSTHPWSAAFISWVVRQAGTGPVFRYSAAHAVYVAAAKENRLANNSNPVRAWRVTEVRPRPGDLVCKSRSGSGATYDNVRPGQTTHCDIVVSVQPGFVNVIGGNVNNSVTRRRIPINAQGFLTGRTHFAIVTLDGFRPGSGVVAPVILPPSNPSIAGTPRVLGQESQAAGRTLYVEIDNRVRNRDGSAVRPVTGIFIPSATSLSSSVDMLLYMHGFRTASSSFTIRDLWNVAKHPHFDLREQTAAARRNMILAAPTLGSHSEAGILTEPGGLDRYLQQVMSALRGAGVTASLPSVRRFVLASHSGGGLPMRRIATGSNRLTSRLLECWGFDCTYNRGDDSQWAQWAASNPQGRLYIYYISGSPTARLAESLRRQGGVNVHVSAAGTRIHNLVPHAHLRERLAAGPLG